MKNALNTLKSKKVWIPLAIFLVLFFSIACAAYFLSKAVVETAEDSPAFPINDIVMASIDPDKRKHLQKAEFAYFDGEKYAAQRNYEQAHESFADSVDEFVAAMGKSSPVVCIMLIRQSEFEAKYNKYDRAEAVLHQALKNLPGGSRNADLTFTANRWLGYVLQRHRKFSEAIPVLVANVSLGQKLDLSRRLSMETNRRMALKALSSCYVAAKRYDDASKVSQDLLAIAQKQPNNKELTSEAWVDLGRIETYREKYSEAVGYYNRALAVDPRCAEAYRMRGIAYSELKQYRNAISDFSLIIQLDRKDDNAYQWRAYAYELNGDRDNAIADLTSAIGLSAHDESIYDNRARLLAGAGRYKEAIADYGESLALDDNSWTHMYRGQAYDQLGQHQEAIVDYTRALQSGDFVKHPPMAPPLDDTGKTMGSLVYEKRARCYTALGERDRAAADRAKSAELDAAEGHAARPVRQQEATTQRRPEPEKKLKTRLSK